jgi:hypothetical protein
MDSVMVIPPHGWQSLIRVCRQGENVRRYFIGFIAAPLFLIGTLDNVVTREKGKTLSSLIHSSR